MSVLVVVVGISVSISTFNAHEADARGVVVLPGRVVYALDELLQALALSLAQGPGLLVATRDINVHVCHGQVCSGRDDGRKAEGASTGDSKCGKGVT